MSAPSGSTPSTAESPASMDGGKRSAWMSHVKKTMKAHKGMKLGQVLKMASKTFKKSRKGGAALTPATVGGRRRSRKSKKGTRKH